MTLPKYKYLLTYRYGEMLCDLGVLFCRIFLQENPTNLSNLDNLSHLRGIPLRRTVDQFIQALRSGKHPDRTLTCSQGLHPCLARARLRGNKGIQLARQRLLREPCTNSTEKASGKIGREDFLRQRNLNIWPKTDSRIADFREIGYKFSNLSNLSPLGNLSNLPILPSNPEEAANFLLTLLHIETFLLSKQIKSAENKFLSEGGYTENLYHKRVEFRRAEELKKLRPLK